MRAARALRAALALLAAASASPAVAHTGGTNGYASIAIDGATARYTLTLWPATLPAGGGRDAPPRPRLTAAPAATDSSASSGTR